ncbi:MAG TPA: AAA family ATPase [Bryobacteraceae bacterium]|nr:AAA family ATPase [Bryobacteraceae bacterium]
MTPVEDMVQEAAAVQAATPEGADIIRPYSTRSWAELGRMDLPLLEMLWGGTALGPTVVVYGIGGLGKSRLALNLARNQVLGLPFAGLPTCKRPLRHLMMGSENSIHRLQHDVRKMQSGLTGAQIELLDAHIRLATLEEPDDPFISLSSPENQEKWMATLTAWPPDVLCLDPWGDLLDGEANSDEDNRATLMALRRMLRKVNPTASLEILAHSRTGAKNIAQAVGYDAANFGKGSKALYSAARSVWNLAPGDETDNPPVVGFHAKHNDSPADKPFALRLDSNTMTYTPVPDFDFDAWQADVSARAAGKGGAKISVRLSLDEAYAALGDRTETKTGVLTVLRDAGATRDGSEDLLRRLLAQGRWESWRPPGRHSSTYVGPPGAIQMRRAEVATQLQRKLAV